MSLADALKANNTRHRVNLSYSTTSDSGTSALADALKTTVSVTEINQSLATIGDSGAVALADVLKANEGRSGEPDGAFDLDRAERTHHDNTSSGTRAHGCVDACRDDPHEASNVDEMTRQRALVGWTLASSHGWL